MKKKLLFLLIVLLLVVGVTGCDLIKKEEPKPTEEEVVAFTVEDLQLLEKLANYAFVPEKEALTVADFSEEQKSMIARSLVSKNYDEATGTEMIEAFHKYFGEDQEVTLQDIICNMEHQSEEEQTLYYFDEEQDKYVYNEKHPGHGGGKSGYYDAKLVFDSIELEGNKYIYNMKVMFYGPAMIPDVGSMEYGSGYKTYEDATKGINPLLVISDNPKYTFEYDGPPTTDIDAVMEDYKDQLDTYSFIFEKVDNHLVFKEYKKA